MKAILVIDIPNDMNAEDYYCDVLAHHRADKPCPVYKMVCQWKEIHLKPMPEKREPKEEWLNKYHRDEFADGWNACLEEIEK